MTFELDPELRLHTRVSLGRGWQRAALVGLGTLGVAGIASGSIATPFTDPRSGGNDALPIALIVLMFAPSRAVARLFDLEQRGLLADTGQ